MIGLSTFIKLICFAVLLSFMAFLALSRQAFTFFLDGLTNSLPLYLRMLTPRKSNPLSICVILVFSSESSSYLAERNFSTMGLTSFPSNSLELPVMIKSSAYLTICTLSCLRNFFSSASNPSSVIFDNVGEIIPPCGVPASVG